MTSDTPRTDAAQLWHFDEPVVPKEFAQQLEQELAHSLENQVNTEDDLIRTQIEMQLKIDKAEAEVERLQNGFQGSCYCCEPVGILNQKLEAEVERLRDAFSHLTNEIECTPKCLSHQSDHCDCGRLERAYAISHSIAQNPTK